MATLVKIIWQTALFLTGIATCFAVVVAGCAMIVNIWEEIRESK